MWDLPGPGLEPVSPALAGRLSTTAPPGKPSFLAHVTVLCRLGEGREDSASPGDSGTSFFHLVAPPSSRPSESFPFSWKLHEEQTWRIVQGFFYDYIRVCSTNHPVLSTAVTTAGGDSEQRCGSRHTPQWGYVDGISALGAPRAWEAPL